MPRNTRKPAGNAVNIALDSTATFDWLVTVKFASFEREMIDIDGNMRIWKIPARGEYYDLSLFWSQNGTFVDRVVIFIWLQTLSWNIKLHVLVSLLAKLLTPWKHCWLHIPSPVNVILMARHAIIMKKAYYLKVCTKLWNFRSWGPFLGAPGNYRAR